MKLVYPELDGRNEWKQTSNPATNSTIEGYQSVKLDFEIDGHESPWGGLGLCTGTHYALISDTPTSENYYMCIGCQTWYPSSGTIPGPRKPGSTVEHAVTRVELYIVKGKIP